MSIRLLIADDHEVVRCGLRNLVAGTDIEIVGEATTGDEAIQRTLELRPDVALIDIRMPGADGLTALARLKLECPEIAVLLLSTYDNPTYVARAVALGAAGYVLKGTDREGILDAIRKAAVGETVWTRDELRRVTGALATGAWPDEQGDCGHAAHQLRDGQGACPAHLAQGGRLGPHAGGRVGCSQRVGLKCRAVEVPGVFKCSCR
jgi:DNA-binding NarL/FixJ family response regulator